MAGSNKPKIKVEYDFFFLHHGSICTLRPVTTAGKAWVEDHISEEAPRFGDVIGVEPRFADDVMNAIAESSLLIAGDDD